MKLSLVFAFFVLLGSISSATDLRLDPRLQLNSEIIWVNKPILEAAKDIVTLSGVPISFDEKLARRKVALYSGGRSIGECLDMMAISLDAKWSASQDGGFRLETDPVQEAIQLNNNKEYSAKLAIAVKDWFKDASNIKANYSQMRAEIARQNERMNRLDSSPESFDKRLAIGQRLENGDLRFGRSVDEYIASVGAKMLDSDDIKKLLNQEPIYIRFDESRLKWLNGIPGIEKGVHVDYILRADKGEIRAAVRTVDRLECGFDLAINLLDQLPENSEWNMEGLDSSEALKRSSPEIYNLPWPTVAVSFRPGGTNESQVFLQYALRLKMPFAMESFRIPASQPVAPSNLRFGEADQSAIGGSTDWRWKNGFWVVRSAFDTVSIINSEPNEEKVIAIGEKSDAPLPELFDLYRSASNPQKARLLSGAVSFDFDNDFLRFIWPAVRVILVLPQELQTRALNNEPVYLLEMPARAKTLYFDALIPVLEGVWSPAGSATVTLANLSEQELNEFALFMDRYRVPGYRTTRDNVTVNSFFLETDTNPLSTIEQLDQLNYTVHFGLTVEKSTKYRFTTAAKPVPVFPPQ